MYYTYFTLSHARYACKNEFVSKMISLEFSAVLKRIITYLTLELIGI